MVRRKDKLWDHVEKKDGGLLCKFCQLKFAAGTSISRIKSHLSGVKGKGIHICTKVAPSVREAAYLEMQGANKRLKTMPQPTNDELNSTSSSSQNRCGINQVRDGERLQRVQSIDQQVREEGNFPQEVENYIFNTRQEEDEILEVGRFPEGISSDARETSEDALITTKIAGQAFQKNMDEIWSCLLDDEILSIGIYGMGGAGKTALMKHVHNRLLETPNTFCHVFWITISPDYKIHKLQNDIAKGLGLDLSKEDDENKRATRLSKALIRKGKCVLILDDVWNYIPLDHVGVPVSLKGCRLIITTRSFDVCRMMGSQKNVKLEPLSEEEAWDLFREKLGNETTLSPEVRRVAKSIARECAGLPLGIISMARSMSREVDICEWRNAMEELRGSIPRHDNMEVFQTMKLSYDYLNDLALQQCFLYCALFPKDCWIKRQHLIERFIDEGLINGLKSREAEFDKGHTMLNRLEKVCLLESDTDIHRNRAVKMHHMIRNMALQILQANSQVLVEAGEQLKEIPEAAKWTKNLFIVSLMRNNIKEIPSSYSPWCPNLSTLLLSENHVLKSIADSFFRQLHGLRILDLSYTDIQKLPDSISDLVSLNVLLLKCCEKLSYLPSLTKLAALKKLDLSWTSIVQLPQGLELLSNLNYLDLSNTSLIEFPAGILLNLSRLQFLSCPIWDVKLNHPLENSRVKGEEIACLKNLETLKCWFYSIDDYITYIQSLDVDSSKSEEGCFENDCWLSTLDQDKEWQRLSNYYLQVGADAFIDDDTDFNFGRAVVFYEGSIGGIGEPLLLPKNIQELELFDCSTGRSLVLENATKLESITVSMCYELECLLSLCSSYAIFQSLQSLRLYQLNNLSFLFGKEEVTGLPPIELLPPANTFFNLKKFSINDCPSIQKLFHSSFVPNLQNLEEIVITNCSQMREIIAVEEPEQGRAMGEESNRSCRNPSFATSSEFHLQNLKLLKLVNLPALKSICSEVMNCDSIQDIHVVHCPMLKNMPVSLPLPSLKRIGVYPKEWWESVEWDNPTRKNALLPLCVFRGCW